MRDGSDKGSIAAVTIITSRKCRTHFFERPRTSDVLMKIAMPLNLFDVDSGLRGKALRTQRDVQRITRARDP